MKFAILAVCVAAVAAKPHVYLYNGPAPIGNDGRIIETPIVTQAKAAHLASIVNSKPIRVYRGPPAPLGEDGRVIDTAEVAQLRAERLAALNKATAEAEEFAATHPYVEPAYETEDQSQDVPIFIVKADHQGYSGPLASVHAQVYYDAPVQGIPAVTYGEAPVQKAQVIPATTHGIASAPAQPQKTYNGPAAPLGQDGRVVDTDEVAKLKAEHLKTLAKANAMAAAIQDMEAAIGYAYDAPAPVATAAPSSSVFEGYSYEAPVQKAQTIPASTYGIESVQAQSQQKYNGPPAPLGPDGNVIDTDEVAKLKAEHLETLAKANAMAAAIEAMEAATTPAAPAASNSFSSEGYFYKAPVKKFETPSVPAYDAPTPSYGAPAIPSASEQSQQKYDGPSAPLGSDGQVIDTDEVAKLKAEHLEALANANAEAAAIEAMEAATTPAVPAASSSSSFGGYSYVPPVQKAQEIPATTYGVKSVAANFQQKYNGPPAPLGPDGRVIDTDEVAKLKAEHLETLAKAAAEAAAIEAMEAATTPETPAAPSSSSSSGYFYKKPVQKFEIPSALSVSSYDAPAPSYGAPVQPQQKYNGPPAPLGPDGQVIDTDEVAKLKAEHLETLAKATAEAAAIEAMEAAINAESPAAPSSSSSSGYFYEKPAQKFEIPSVPVHDAPAASYGAPAQPQQKYNGPPAPLGPDGQVIDTDEVAKLKAEHLETLAKATAEAAAIEAMEAAINAESPAAPSSSSSSGYFYEKPAQKFEIPSVPVHDAPAASYGAPAQPQQKYNGPPAPLGPDGQVIDTDEVAKLKAEHLETLAKATTEAAAIEAMEAAINAESPAAPSSSSSSGYFYEKPAQKFEIPSVPVHDAPAPPTSSSSEGYIYEKPIKKFEAPSVPSYVAPATSYGAPAQPQQKYNGPPAPLGPDGQVIDTDEVAKLKAEHLETLAKATAEAAAIEAMEAAINAESPAAPSSSSSSGYFYEKPAQKFEIPSVPVHDAPAPLTSSSSEGYIYEKPIKKFEAPSVPSYVAPAASYGAPAQPQQKYNGPPAPLGPDGQVIDTDEVAKLKAEHLETLAKATAEAAAIEAMEAAINPATPAAPSSSSSSGYFYGEPVQKFENPSAPVHDAPAAPSLPSSEGYFYEKPTKKFQTISVSSYDAPAPSYGTPSVQSQQKYTGPPAPLGPDGQVIDTDEVAKLKAEHLETLAKATAEAAAIEAMEAAINPATPAAPSSSSSSGYFYEEPVQKFENPSAPVHDAPAAPSLPSSEGYFYEKPTKKFQTISVSSYDAPAPSYGTPSVQSQQKYTGPPAPLGPDGQVIDTDEVAKLKAEHLETLAKATAEAAAIEAMKAATTPETPAAPSSSSSEGYLYEKPVQVFDSPSASTYGTPVPSYGAPAAEPQQVYNGPAAPLGQDGAVIDTDEVAKLKAEHIAALEKANAAAAAAEAASGSSSEEEKGYSYEAPVSKLNPPKLFTPAFTYGVVKNTDEVAQLKAEQNVAIAQANEMAQASAEAAPSSSASSAEVTKGYSGPFAPLSADGQVIDTDEVAQLKAEHLAALAKATAEAIAYASAEEIENNKYLPPLPAQKAYERNFRNY